MRLYRRGLKEVDVRAVSLADINKALAPKGLAPDPRSLLPEELMDLAPLFDEKEDKGLPKRRPGSNHEINLEKDEAGREKPVP